MAPIRHASWAPRNTKPAWDWKARGSAELNNFDDAFGIKEYVQNAVGKACGGQERSETVVDGHVSWSPHRTARRLPRARHLSSALHSFGRSANPDKTNVKVAIVLWTTGSAFNALTVFNNHLDENATFDSFTVDGESTSKANEWAVGEKGKGFILATQYLVEEIDDRIASKERENIPRYLKFGASFRVGEQIGEFKWKKSRSRRAGAVDSLRVILDDLTTRSVADYLPHKYYLEIDDCPDGGIPETYDASLETNKMREKAATILKEAQKQRIKYRLDVDGKSVVNADEVCITIIGLDCTDEPEKLFSAIYGIIPPPRQWRIHGSNFQFFISSDKPRFYHRDQLIPKGIHLCRISLNYHGNLTLSPERMSVTNDWNMTQYRHYLRASLHDAFLTLPDLAIELALDILADEHSDALAGILLPPNKDGAGQYRTAFEAAMRRRLHRTTDLPLHPYAGTEENLKLFTELDLAPVRVSHKALNIMHQSGAYAPVKEYARRILLDAPPVPDFPGLDRVRAALRTVLPTLPAENITVRDYDKLYPTVIWDDTTQNFAFALPESCEDHPDGQCMCWIGPVLQDAAKDYNGPISSRKLWRAFAEEMGGNTAIKPRVIQQQSGVNYTPVKQYARGLLLAAPPVPDLPGLDRLRAALKKVLPSLPADNITVRNYDKVYPTVIWDDQSAHLAFGVPKPCEDHAGGHCLCWIGPALQDAAQESKGRISARRLWRAPRTDEYGEWFSHGNFGTLVSIRAASLYLSVAGSQLSSSPSASLGWKRGSDAFTQYDAMATEIQTLREASTSQQKQIEDLSKIKAARDGEIGELKEGIKELREDLAYYMEGPPSKRRRLVETPSTD
ncbi:hypothetical protein DFH06DRAFT_1479124 [Mycena polygramma]|nr:hypothetical protein DFH06DRAFT_1479124 [Mycena polygramma]